jgi:hypothetical protein
MKRFKSEDYTHTENTVTNVLKERHEKGPKRGCKLGRLWGILVGKPEGKRATGKT